MGPYQPSIRDIQQNVVVIKPLSAGDRHMLSKIEDQEGFVQKSSPSYDQVELNGVCDLWSSRTTKSSCLCGLFQWFSGDVVETC